MRGAGIQIFSLTWKEKFLEHEILLLHKQALKGGEINGITEREPCLAWNWNEQTEKKITRSDTDN